MEHSVLGGSEKYPLKEPFVQLIKGSLKTFLNAFTSPDKTTYPVASTNLQDFYNLVDVYLDAVFHPLITPNHLAQEGWHYELEDPDAPLAYKGVVFNEMKGVYSSPDAILQRAGQRALFPDNAYGHDSGGDPRAIPDLTYEQFKGFHETYYHPSNALIFFYGDDDPEERLRILDAVLSDFEPLEVDSSVALQQPFDEPRRVIASYGVDEGTDIDRKTFFTLGWLLPENVDPALTMALFLLSHALVGTQASPLRKALVDSGLGEDVIGGGLSTNLRQMTFRVGLKNMASEDVDKAETLILETLARLADEGIEDEMVEAALNSIEFSLRENNTGVYPRGLIAFLKALGAWLYGRDPLTPLRFEAPLAEVKARLAEDDGYLQSLIRTYLLENPHRVTTILEPDPTFNQRQAEEERQRLEAARAQMSAEDIQAVIEQTRELKRLQEAQDSPEVVALLPTLTIDDLEREVKTIPIEVEQMGGEGELLFHDLFTNGIVYLDLVFDMHGVPQELLPYADFFAQSLLKLGTEREDYVKLSQRIGRSTGGISASSMVAPLLADEEGLARFVLRGKATVAQVPEMLDIMRDMLLTVKLDNPERFRQIVLETKARMEGYVVPSGSAYVGSRLRAHFNKASWVEEQMDGVEGIFFVRRLAELVDEDWPSVLAALEEVRQLIVNRRGVIFNVTATAGDLDVIRPRLDDLFNQLPSRQVDPVAWTPDELPAREGLTIPAQVNYVGKGADLYRLGYVYHGSINVIMNLVRTSWLWDQVRAQGGAYGVYNRFSRQSGVWTFLSYRDPNLQATLDAYDATARFLREHDFTQDEITKGVIGAIGGMDAYQLPDAKGRTSLNRYLMGVSDEERQQIRDEILGTTVQDLRAFADFIDAVAREGDVVVLGSADAISQAGGMAVTQVL
jgi:Zn-dependent M16 (insulinase) family peptidase